MYQVTVSAVAQSEIGFACSQRCCHTCHKRDQRTGQASFGDVLRDMQPIEAGAGARAGVEAGSAFLCCSRQLDMIVVLIFLLRSVQIEPNGKSG